jgi:Immunity protein 72
VLSSKPALTLSLPPSLIVGSTNISLSKRHENIGCMNYLLANTSAPYYQDGELDQPLPVIWRLIWKDERYLDGTIPQEETSYLAAHNELETSMKFDNINIRLASGETCPRAGYYSTPVQTNSRRHFNQGDPMPSLSGDYGVTIWQWDGKQT